jgi:sulfite reductase beta subunit-like hemoprotein
MSTSYARPEPLLKTPLDQINEVEQIKRASNGLRGELNAEFNDYSKGDITEASEALAKSHGIYLEYNRAKTGTEKDWMYMIRLALPGGGVLNAAKWNVLDEIARKYTVSDQGLPSLRLTTRQCVQFHWVKKQDLIKLMQDVAATDFFALNGCGDNTRNIMACPLSRFSTLYNAHADAMRFAKFFQLPGSAHMQVFEIDASKKRWLDDDDSTGPRFAYDDGLLNRKFKIAFATAHRNPLTGKPEYDNCVEMRTNDLGYSPIIENDKVAGFQLYVGGGQGERNGKPSFSTLSRPLGIVTPDQLLPAMDAIVKVHQTWGDRKNRHWARLKYVVLAQGIEWYQNEVRNLGVQLQAPDNQFDPGPRHMHHGWTTQESNGKLARGVWVECGRLINRNGYDALDMVKELTNTFDTEVTITANQDLLFTNLDPAAKDDFDAVLHRFTSKRLGGRKISRLRSLSGACVGLPTCRLSYTDSEEFGPELFAQLEDMGYGDLNESVGITGCERQCFRPGTKTVGWVGQGPDMYMLKIGGDEAGRHQGTPIVEDGKLFLRQVSREQVAHVTAAIFDFWKQGQKPGEDVGAFVRRVGHLAVLNYFRSQPKLAPVLAKTAKTPYLPANDPVKNEYQNA